MTDAVFLVALLCGIVAAFKGDRTAVALLGSAAFTAGITLVGVPFHPVLWMMIDLCVVLAVIRPSMTVYDTFVIALFIPVWCLYATMPDWVSEAVTCLVALQFFLSFPIPQLWCRCARPVFRRGGPPDILRMIYA